MAEIVTTIDRDRDLTVRTVKGAVAMQELLETLATYHDAQPTRSVLWDFSEAQLERLTGSEVSTLAQLTARQAEGRPGGRTALVFASELAFGLGRMFDQTRNVSGSPVEYMSFRDRAAALAWLGGSEA